MSTLKIPAIYYNHCLLKTLILLIKLKSTWQSFHLMVITNLSKSLFTLIMKISTLQVGEKTDVLKTIPIFSSAYEPSLCPEKVFAVILCAKILQRQDVGRRILGGQLVKGEERIMSCNFLSHTIKTGWLFYPNA